MKPEEFPGNTQNMRYEYHRVREGPNYFVSFYKNSSRLHYDPKDTWRTLGTAKFTDTGKSLKDWCLQMYEDYSIPQMEKWYGADGAESELSDSEALARSGRKDTSFASEAMGDEESSLEEENPCENTKMVM